MSPFLKRVVEKGLRGLGAASAARAAHRDNTLVLAYHNIVPDGEPIVGDLGLHLPQRQFARQLDWLRRTHEIVHLASIFDQSHTRARPRAVITFDDAYRGAVTVGLHELAVRDLPATIFVAPALLGCRGFWWDRLAPEHTDGLPPEVRRHCIETLYGRNDLVLAWATERNIAVRSVPHHQSPATEDELATCVLSGSITLASHTWSHPNVSRIEGQELREQLQRPLTWLARRFSQVIPWLAYPYGLASTASVEAARAVGYQGAFLVRGGSIAHRDLTGDRLSLPRLNIPAAISLDGFALRASGLSPHWPHRRHNGTV